MTGFNVVDTGAAILLLVGALGGLKRGLSGELSRVVGISVAVSAAWRFATPVADWAMDSLNLPQDRSYLLSFGAIFLSAIAILLIVRFVLRNLMSFAFKGKIERIGGLLAGLIRSSVIVGALVLMLEFAPQDNVRAAVTENSVVGRLVARYLRPVYENFQQRVPELGRPPFTEPAEPDLGETTEPPADESAPPP